MFLLIQFPTKFQFSEILITSNAVIGFFFIIATMGGSIDQRNSPNINKTFRYLIQFCIGSGYIGLMFIIPALVYSFSITGTFVLIAVEIPIVIIFYKNFPDVHNPDTKTNQSS